MIIMITFTGILAIMFILIAMISIHYSASFSPNLFIRILVLLTQLFIGGFVFYYANGGFQETRKSELQEKISIINTEVKKCRELLETNS